MNEQEKEELETQDAVELAHINAKSVQLAEEKFMLGQEEILINCPYMKSHMTTNKRSTVHFEKCRAQYLAKLKNPDVDCKVHVCKFDLAHHIPEAEYKKHLLECSKRDLREELRGKSQHGVQVPQLGFSKMVRMDDEMNTIKRVKLGYTAAAEDSAPSTNPAAQDKGQNGNGEDEWAIEPVPNKIAVETPAERLQICVWGGKILQPSTPEPSPPKDVFKIEKIDYRANFDVKYPRRRYYRTSPPFWTDDERSFLTTDLDTTEVTTSESKLGPDGRRFGIWSSSDTTMGIISSSKTTDYSSKMKGYLAEAEDTSGAGAGPTDTFSETESGTVNVTSTEAEDADSEPEMYDSIVD